MSWLKIVLPCAAVAAAAAVWYSLSTGVEAPGPAAPARAVAAPKQTQTTESPAVPAPMRTADELRAERDSALANILTEPSRDARLRKFLNLLEHLTAADAPAAYTMLEKLTKLGKDVSYELGALQRRWGELDPKGALAHLDTRPKASHTRDSYEQLFQGWTSADAKAALEWLAANPKHPQYAPALLGYVGASAGKDLNGATHTVYTTMPADSPLLGDALQRLASAARDVSPETLKTWFAGLPADDATLAARQMAARHVARLLPPDDYAANSAWMTEQTRQPWRTNGLIQEFAYKFAGEFPKNAMNWVEKTAPSPGPQPAAGIIVGVQEIVGQWQRRSMKDLQEWLETHRDSPVFNQAARDLAFDQAKKNLPLAEYWGAQLTQPWPKEQVERELAKYRPK